ncbi:monosaccharide ABC transporter ATP-binding protein (CUT2 family) [Mobilisporobacter senegalensis]|uniref:Monosaccharide ABC transporter ATP-binding protein (CUT2 family) n=1 Tax=Mobilisporobacter senegalensis TaxID=1329262 RepID=A0A3N1XLF4_9FIRM|nr:sugar ABC transporter ATP-binding protein [Mobilisporobacter senegalensis]ROR27516.1 monosaccharide ABC transporter ATP-binding protein (CUT2 family) [Mobilisporobacter senegalensis]
MSTQNYLLEAHHISKSYTSAVIALKDVRFQLQGGEIHALLGENGAGKSTLIKVLTGVEERDTGLITLEGKEIYPKTPQEGQKIGISSVYQEVNLCPNLSVAENIYIGREPRKKGRIDWKTIYVNARILLEKFDLDIDVTKDLDQYSVAIQQMIAIARACDIRAKVLILDEPTSSLSTNEVNKLFEIMRRLKKDGMGIIFVTHFIDQVYEITDRITVLRNGEYVGTYETANLPKVELVGKMIGKDYAQLNRTMVSYEEEYNSGDTFLELKEVSGLGTIKNLDLSIRQGEVLGLSGLLGSGRSEIARIIFGIDSLEKGTIEIKGKKIFLKNTLAAIKNGIAFCPENRKTEGIVGDLSIRDNIILALQAKQGLFKSISKREASRIADEYIEKLEIKTPSKDQKIKNLSGGNQQKVILARWLATDPNLLMLDEPTRGIDIGTKAEILKIVIDLAKQGMGVIFISSEIDEMLRCCGRMVILRDMRKVMELKGREISQAAIMHHIAGGDKDE